MDPIDLQLRLKPVVAFDVDGALRVQRSQRKSDGEHQDLEGILSIPVTMEREEYPDIYHGAPRWNEQGKSHSIEHFSEVGVNLLRKLSKENRTEPVLATTWQRWANLYFGKPLGIRELPVAVKTLEPLEANYFHCSPAWKAHQLSRQFDGRPLLWIDDNMTDREGEDLVGLRRPEDRALTLVYETNTYLGLTAEDVEKIEEWLELASTAEGQSTLRETWEQEQKKLRAQQLQWEEKRELKRKIQDLVEAELEERYPGQSLFNHRIAALARERSGLEAKSVRYWMTRFGISGDAGALAAELRVEGYHLPQSSAVEKDENF